MKIEKLLPEQFSVNFGAKSDETFIWLTSNQYLTSQATTIYRGAIASNGESQLLTVRNTGSRSFQLFKSYLKLGQAA